MISIFSKIENFAGAKIKADKKWTENRFLE